MQLLFPFSEYWWFYAAFIGFVLLMLVVDLGVFHREPHRISFKESATWSAVWVSLALMFSGLLYVYASWKFPLDARLTSIPGFDPVEAAHQVSLEFLTGFVVEKSLAIDNIFVFVTLFNFFAIPDKYQHRVLFFGIIGALIFRAAFIALGAVLMRYQGVILFFGAMLIITGVRMLFLPERKMDPSKNIVIRLMKKAIPITPELHGPHFVVKEGGRWMGTPLLIALVFIEFCDIIFAVDSVPAIFALTNEPLIVFTSNVFAILGLRALYFMLAGVIDRFYLLKFGLAFVLIFVGLKMVWLNDLYGGKFPILLSLGIIASIIGLSVLASFLFPKKTNELRPEER